MRPRSLIGVLISACCLFFYTAIHKEPWQYRLDWQRTIQEKEPSYSWECKELEPYDQDEKNGLDYGEGYVCKYSRWHEEAESIRIAKSKKREEQRQSIKEYENKHFRRR